MQVKARMPLEPAFHRGGLVGGIIVDNEMQVEIGQRAFVDGFQEAEELARLGCRYIQVDAPDFGQLVDQTQRDAWERADISVDRVFSEGADMLNEVAGIPGVARA